MTPVSCHKEARTLKGRLAFIDLDGVLADFIRGVLELHKLPIEETISKLKGNYNIAEALGIPTIEFWGTIDNSRDFWATLPKTHDADLILDTILHYYPIKQVYLLTAPSYHPNCYYGKVKWVNKHYPKLARRLILTGHKHLIAAPSRLLIDDSDANCSKFIKAGGKAILYPRYWNVRHPEATPNTGSFKAFSKDMYELTKQ